MPTPSSFTSERKSPFNPTAFVMLLERIAKLCMAVAGIMMVALIAIFGWLVFGRYVLNDTPTWVEQASLLLVVWITFLGTAVGVWRHSHLSIEFVRDAFPERVRNILCTVSDLALAVFGGFMAWYGGALVAGTSRRIIPMLGIAESWRAAPLMICGGLVVLFALANLFLRHAPTDRTSP